MQVVLTLQPIFDPRQARSWVKQYDIVEDKPLESAETISQPGIEEDPALSDSQKIRIRKSKASDAVPSHGLLTKMVESGLPGPFEQQDALAPRAEWLSGQPSAIMTRI
jgi:hypothetical protein